ncbi:MAG: methyltransferase, TrmH family [Acidobacteriota bacterium]|jgi:TrmH family RNA methyltransferase|nr:methyltransferase, TrmH family [Acidobacteriota bacterium]
MTSETITSRKNPLAQRARAVRDGREKEFVFVEGVRLCEEALRASVMFEAVLYTRTLSEDKRGSTLLERLREVCLNTHVVSEDVLESVSDTKTPQGVVALARRPQTGREVVERAVGVPLVVVMHRANNPSNVGAVLRVAEAAGATGVILTKGSTDPLSPKSLRGSMGSAFRLPLWTGTTLEEVLGWCAVRAIHTVATAAGVSSLHTELDWTTPRAVVLGPEAGGLSEDELSAAGEAVRIPMREPVESLNLATALAVLLYEAARQRHFS